MIEDPPDRLSAAPPRHFARRELLIGGGLLAGAAGASLLKPHRRADALGERRLERMIPEKIGEWRFVTAGGLVLPPPDALRDRLYSQLLTRTYIHDARPSVMLLIAYGGTQNGMIQIHRPEFCYPAAGYRLAMTERHMVPVMPGVSIPARAMLARSDWRSEQLIYWTRLGHHFPVSWAEQHIAVLSENIAGSIPDGVLVRISSGADRLSPSVLDGFARDLCRAVGPRMRRILFGTSGPRPASS